MPIPSNSDTALDVAVMGTGRWGRNLVRVLEAHEGVRLRWLVDPDPAALSLASALAPGAQCVSRIDETSFGFEMAAVSTPARCHFAHALPLIEKGKHVFVEKPAALTLEDAGALAAGAVERGCRFMVGHQLLFHPAFERLSRLASDGVLGPLRAITAERTGDVDLSREPGVLWSYGPHDVAMILMLAREAPAAIRARGTLDGEGLPTTAEVTLGFGAGLTATVRLAANDGTRVRRLTVRGDRAVAVFDDGVPGGRLTLHTSGAEEAIAVPGGEPLALQLADFIDSIRKERPCRNGTAHMMRVICVLAASEEQISRG